MDEKLEKLIRKIKDLENEIRVELQKKQEEFYYHVDRNKIRFEQEVKRQHKLLSKKLHRYFYEARLGNLLTVPVIWSCIFPALLLDGVVSVFQWLCFPVYGIPKVKRSRYVIIDRHVLSYLNLIEKINCIYCGYFNGLISYVQEVAARTEQYWCPIKHARRISSFHSRYKYFFDYGDGEEYRRHLDQVRQNFADLQEEDSEA